MALQKKSSVAKKRLAVLESFRMVGDTKSLAFRQFIASLILLPIMLIISAYGLVNAFKASLLTAEREALKAQTYILLGGAEPDEERLTLPEYFIEPRLNNINSGLYAYITDDSGKVLWRSRSLSLSSIDFEPPKDVAISPGQELFTTFFKGDLGSFFMLRFDTVWNIKGEDKLYRFHVVHSRKPYREEVNLYKNEMVALLFLLAFLILALQFTIMHFGFHPLRKLANRLGEFQEGKTERLEGTYAAEITPVIENLNMLLENEKRQRARYKNTLSDLAHSLKTPLSVINVVNEKLAREDTTDIKKNIQEIDQQISRMSDIIDHQLRRATMQSSLISHQEVNLREQVNRLVDAMSKVYRDKGVECKIVAPTSLSVSIEPNDLLEILGNIIENAFKYCKQRVSIECRYDKADIIIAVGDDGKGISAENRDKVLNRGARADTVRPGQGIGLSVSVDIISSYNGSLTVDQSQLGGALFIVTLPR